MQLTVQKALVQHPLHQWLNSTDFDQLGHQVFTAWFDVGKNGHTRANFREIIERKRHIGLARNRQQMQHCVRRATQGDNDSDGILKGFPRHDVERLDVFPHEVQHRLAGAVAVIDLLV